jgi:ABC-type glycerol-3-phosphate transport system substrate-binding protein
MTLVSFLKLSLGLILGNQYSWCGFLVVDQQSAPKISRRHLMKVIVRVVLLFCLTGALVFAGGGQSAPTQAMEPLPPELEWPVNELGPKPNFDHLSGQVVNLDIALFAAGHVAMIEQFATNFKRLYPNIRLTINVQQIPTAELHDSLAAQLVAGVGAPDIVAIEISRTGRFFVDPYSSQFRNIQLPGQLRENLTQQSQYQDTRGRQVGIDMVGPEPGFLYYRKDIFDQIGVTEPPATWEEYIEIGRRLKSELGYHLTSYGFEARSDMAQIMPLIVQAGNPIFANGQFVLNRQDTLQVLQTLVQLHREGLITDSHRDNPILLQRYVGLHPDQVASFIMPMWYFNTRLANAVSSRLTVQEPVWRIAAPPRFPSSEYSAFSWGGTALAIVESQSRNPELAEAFLHYFLSSENQIQKFEKFGFLPSSVVALSSDRVTGLTMPGIFGDQPVGQIYADAAKNLPPYALGPTWPQVFVEAEATFDQVLSRGPQAWLNSLQALEAEIR